MATLCRGGSGSRPLVIHRQPASPTGESVKPPTGWTGKPKNDGGGIKCAYDLSCRLGAIKPETKNENHENTKNRLHFFLFFNPPADIHTSKYHIICMFPFLCSLGSPFFFFCGSWFVRVIHVKKLTLYTHWQMATMIKTSKHQKQRITLSCRVRKRVRRWGWSIDQGNVMGWCRRQAWHYRVTSAVRPAHDARPKDKPTARSKKGQNDNIVMMKHSPVGQWGGSSSSGRSIPNVFCFILVYPPLSGSRKWIVGCRIFFSRTALRSAANILHIIYSICNI